MPWPHICFGSSIFWLRRVSSSYLVLSLLLCSMLVLSDTQVLCYFVSYRLSS